jgi:hypothetical protein
LRPRFTRASSSNDGRNSVPLRRGRTQPFGTAALALAQPGLAGICLPKVRTHLQSTRCGDGQAARRAGTNVRSSIGSVMTLLSASSIQLWHGASRKADAVPFADRQRRSSTRGTPRGLLESIDLIIKYLWSLSSYHILRSPSWDKDPKSRPRLRHRPARRLRRP